MNADNNLAITQISSLISNIISNIVLINEKKFNKKAPSSIFDLSNSSSFKFESFINKLIKSWEADYSTVISALILIDRITKMANIVITDKNIYTLFTSALLIAIKLNEDIIYRDKDFAQLAKLSISTLIFLERSF